MIENKEVWRSWEGIYYFLFGILGSFEPEWGEEREEVLLQLAVWQLLLVLILSFVPNMFVKRIPNQNIFLSFADAAEAKWVNRRERRERRDFNHEEKKDAKALRKVESLKFKSKN